MAAEMTGQQRLRQEHGVTGSRNSALMVSMMAGMAGFSGLVFIGSAGPEWRKMLGLSPGIALTAFFMTAPIVNVCIRTFAGSTIDWLGRKTVITVFVSVLAGFIGISALLWTVGPEHMSRKYYALIYLLALLGGAGPAVVPASITSLNYWFPKAKQGFVGGWMNGFSTLGPGVGVLFVPVMIKFLGIKMAYSVWGAWILGTLVIYYLVMKDNPLLQLRKKGYDEKRARELASRMGQELYPTAGVKATLRAALKNPMTWLLMVIYFSTFGCSLPSMAAWYPTYWATYHQVGLLERGLLVGMFVFGNAVLTVIFGRLSDRFGGEWFGLASSLLLIASATVLLNSERGMIAIGALGMYIMSIGSAAGDAAVYKLIPRYCPRSVAGTTGLVHACGALGALANLVTYGLITQSQGVAGFGNVFYWDLSWAFITTPIWVYLVWRFLIRKRPVPAEVEEARAARGALVGSPEAPAAPA